MFPIPGTVATPTTSLIMPSWAFPCYSSAAQILFHLWVTINSLDSYCIWNADNNHSIHKSLFRVSFLPSLGIVAVVRSGDQTIPFHTRPGYDDGVNLIIHFSDCFCCYSWIEALYKPSCTFFAAFSSSSHSKWPHQPIRSSLPAQPSEYVLNQQYEHRTHRLLWIWISIRIWKPATPIQLSANTRTSHWTFSGITAEDFSIGVCALVKWLYL